MLNELKKLFGERYSTQGYPQAIWKEVCLGKIQNREGIIATALFLKEILDQKLVINPKQARNVTKVLLRADTLVHLVVPLCPAWDHDGSGFTFKTVHDDQVGDAFSRALGPLSSLIKPFEIMGVKINVTLLVDDAEVLDLDRSYSLEERIEKDEFLHRIAGQVVCIEKELVTHGLGQCTAGSFLKVFNETDFSRRRVDVENSIPEDKQFDDLVRLELAMYRKQCRLPEGTPDDTAIRIAAKNDLSLLLTYHEFVASKFQPTIFLVEADPFLFYLNDYSCIAFK